MLIVSNWSMRKGRYMRTHLTAPQIKDYIIDTIIIKSKLILRKSDLDELLQKSSLSFASGLLKSDSRTIGFRPEELQELINEIRRNIGDVDHRDGLVITNFIADNERLSKDFEVMIKNSIALLSWHREEFGVEKPLGLEFIDKAISEYGVSELSVFLFLEKMSIHLNESIGSKFSQRIHEEPIDLDNLFKSENLPENSFFDQRFINYLSMNYDKLETIHWRQFEGLVAEFFAREGYEITLNKGRNDGGIDIIARNKIEETVTIIQCKRYRKNRSVSVESVKSFCFDVIDGNFNQGIIVTTSYLTDGEKKIYRNRYPISEVEHHELESWLHKMFK